MTTTPSFIAPGPYAHPSAWRGAEMQRRDDWILNLTAEHNHELNQALAFAKSRNADIPAMQRADFPLPTLAPAFKGMAKEVVDGRGFVLVRGLDIDALSVPDAARIYWGIGAHLGQGRAQNAQGDMLGHVTDLGVDFRNNANVRGYQTKLRLPFHNDTTDIVGLLCLMPARSGGLSRIVSSTAIHNEVRERRPDLLEVMHQPLCLDRRGETPEGKLPYYQGAIFERVGGRLFCRYNRTYAESAQRFPEVPRLTPAQTEVFDLMDSLCDDPALRLDMDFRRGDMQFISNYTVLHSRTAYEDWPEQERRRYLLRLWLTTGLIDTLPASWVDRQSDSDQWQHNPQPPIFDLSMRRAELAH
jgi:hypothetical protein